MAQLAKLRNECDYWKISSAYIQASGGIKLRCYLMYELLFANLQLM